MFPDTPSSSPYSMKREPSSQSPELEWLPHTPPASTPPASQRLKAIQDALRAPSIPASTPTPTQSQSRLQAIQDALKGATSTPAIPTPPSEPVIIQIGGSNRGVNDLKRPSTVQLDGPVVKKEEPSRLVSFLESLRAEHLMQRTASPGGREEPLVRKAMPAPWLEPTPPRTNLKRPLRLRADGQNLPDEHDERVVKKARQVPVPETEPSPPKAKPEPRRGDVGGQKALDLPQPIVKVKRESPTPSPEPSPPDSQPHRRTALDAFFEHHDGFEYDSSQPAWNEFKRLARRNDWDGVQRTQQRDEFKGALVHAFNATYGTDEDSLDLWMKLCRVIGITPLPQGLRACREAVKATHVNLVDLVDLPNSEEPLQLFKSEKELSKYTLGEDKVFPRNHIAAGSLLRHLLRNIMNPGQKRGRRNY
ncbi:hypothetical protein DXG01_015584 [Tephrocybe rancida]|nr:hypothetical protein DXG01_015584 [Tephrocybe rancida]